MDVQLGATSVDTETGEILYPSLYNAETGEYEGICIHQHKAKFRIPITRHAKKEIKRNVSSNTSELELIKAMVFLLPTLIIFHPVVSLLVCIVEMVLHNWAHRKNRHLKDYPFHYKSPLHGIAKEFCGKCKDFSAKEKITRIQDIRNDKMRCGLESIRRVVT